MASCGRTHTKSRVMMNEVSVAVPDVSAPVRLEGQTNSEVLFNWLTVKRFLWMLGDLYLNRFEDCVGTWAAIRVAHRLIRWKRSNADTHPALQLPRDETKIEEAFIKLEQLVELHFFHSTEK